jgi:hypothetical protein
MMMAQVVMNLDRNLIVNKIHSLETIVIHLTQEGGGGEKRAFYHSLMIESAFLIEKNITPHSMKVNHYCLFDFTIFLTTIHRVALSMLMLMLFF